MKNDFKIGQTVISKKPGILNGLSGEILSINLDNRKQLSVICGSFGGTWSFSFDEVELASKDKPENSEYIPTKPKVESVTPIAEIKVKRGYNRKVDKPKGEAKPGKRGRPAKIKNYVK